ncbi:MAG: DUF1207 domain-containing protein [Gemmatimonadota bacterium]
MHSMLLIAALQQLLPNGPLMPGAIADGREPRVAIGFVSSTLFADELVARAGQGLGPGEEPESDVHGVVQLGTNFPLLRIRSAVVSLQGGLISRFRLEAQDNDALSSDFMIALPVSYSGGAWQARMRLIHRSSHLGDELVQNTTIRRLEYDHEEIDGLIARFIGPLRVYGGGTLTLASSFGSDEWGIQFGTDLRRAVGWGPGVGGSTSGWGYTAGIDWQRHSIANGHSRFSAVAGIGRWGPAGQIRLDSVFQTGASPIGEFFPERERYWGLQLVMSRSNGH